METPTTDRKPVAEMTPEELAAELDERGISYEATMLAEWLADLVAGARAREAGPETETEEVVGEVETEEDATARAEVDRLDSQAVVLRDQQAVATTTLFPPAHLFNAWSVAAERLASTQVVPTAYRGKPDDVIAAWLTGYEMNIGAMESLREIYIVDGKPSLSANLLMKRLRQGGVRVLESEASAFRARIRAQRHDTGEICEVEWTMTEAEAVVSKGKRLVDKDNWKNYPADMLWARAVGRLTRRLGSDLIGSVAPYASEELEDWGGEEAPQQTRRGRSGGGAGRLLPKSWAEISQWAEPYGDTLGWKVWVKQAAQALFSVESGSDMSTEQLARLGTIAAGAVAKLVEDYPAGTFPPPTRENVQRVWASALDGLTLPGPEWAMSPQETAAGRPSYYAANGLPEPERPAHAAGEASHPGYGRVETNEADEFGPGGTFESGPAAEPVADAEWTPVAEPERTEQGLLRDPDNVEF